MRDLLLLGGLSDISSKIYIDKVMSTRSAFRNVRLTSFPFDEMEKLRCTTGFEDIAKMFDREIDAAFCGDTAIAICSNTYHGAVPFMRHGSRVMRIDDAVASLRVWSHLRSTLLLATSSTVKSGIYQKRLGECSVNVEVPSDSEQRKLDEWIYDHLCQGQDPVLISTDFDNLFNDKEPSSTILGCTELSLMKQFMTKKKVVDSVAAHLQALSPVLS